MVSSTLSPWIMITLISPFAVTWGGATCMVNNVTATKFAESVAHVTYVEEENKLICTHQACYHTEISGCTTVECQGPSACWKSQIEQASLVNCTMKNSCLEVVMTNLDSGASVNCQGNYACYLADIDATSTSATSSQDDDDDDDSSSIVTCNGYQSCYSTFGALPMTIKASKVICKTDLSCSNVKITANCLECTTENACKYKCATSAEGGSSGTWTPCSEAASETCS
uniref:Uncharacterized protein n=1 Tax=Entomoneis paludosa TaxID=265537 RepID=A0A7S2YNP8_9STRA|mmetsp:Transcript_40315/g.83927  ORF Transcript_40315/g.83927 Transcript_40315/m.83927 type:complete len:227 (+) Transcript_40315:49-729(+)